MATWHGYIRYLVRDKHVDRHPTERIGKKKKKNVARVCSVSLHDRRHDSLVKKVTKQAAKAMAKRVAKKAAKKAATGAVTAGASWATQKALDQI